MDTLKQKIARLPRRPGVYSFLGRDRQVLYVGKATFLRDRVRSYFSASESRGTIRLMLPLVSDINFEVTDSVLEALILEAKFIKKFQPPYNSMGKDDKSWTYFVITAEEFPRVIIVRETDLGGVTGKVFGPYASKRQMTVALGIIRRIFPFHSAAQQTEKGCLDFQLGRCPGPYAGAISRIEYRRNIASIRLILDGRKKTLLRRLKAELRGASQKQDYERAALMRDRIFALEHIQDVAVVSGRQEKIDWEDDDQEKIRIEAYDISNLGGQQAVGSMVVFRGSQPSPKDYRRFRIRTVAGANDVGMMQEVLVRRFGNDWPEPGLIMLDGGIAHLRMAERVTAIRERGIPLMAVAKGPDRKGLDLHLSRSFRQLPQSGRLSADRRTIKRIMDEVHRFALAYHRKLRRAAFLAR